MIRHIFFNFPDRHRGFFFARVLPVDLTRRPSPTRKPTLGLRPRRSLISYCFPWKNNFLSRTF
jgi:hypothetical protein